MSFVTRTAKKSPRLFAIGLLIAMVSTFVLASRWESVRAYTFGSAAVSGQSESSGKLKKSALVDSFVKDDLLLAPGACDIGNNVEVEATGGTNTGYATLSAAFAAINAGTHTGDITIDVCGDTTETATAVLNASGSGAAAYTSVVIAPAGGAARTISGNLALPLIDLSGADNVTINGLNTGGNSLTVSNASTATTAGTSTIRFINDATGNSIQNATIAGAATGASTATVLFAGTTGTTGNDNNTVTASNIAPVGATFPLNAVQSSGTTTSQTTRNSGIQITNNNIFDFFSSAAVANGILAAGSTDWTITGNSFYQTASRAMTVNASGFIGISMADTSGVNFNISNNFIGGSAASAGGAAWTQTGAFTHTFIGIRMSVGTTTPSSLQGNTIQNISVSTTSTSTVNAGISAVSGAMNIGTGVGNTIGATTGTGSITWTGGGTGGRFVGILAGTGTPGGINISNNNVGSITVAGAGTTSLFGIRIEGTATAAYTISGNTIGSNTTASSIQNSTNLATVGISGSQTGFGATVSNNTVRNFNASSTGTAVSLRGIELVGSIGNQNISGNTIRDLTTAGGNTGTTGTAAVNGIVLTGSATSGNVITANTIRDLASTVSSATAVFNNGITITSTPATTISRNLIFNLSTASTSPTSSINGIYLFNSAATENVYNNMIRLGTGVGNNPIIRGVWDNTATSSPTNIYFNSIFIDGTQGAATVNTACISKVVASTMDVKNNILWNNRASTGAPGAATGRHYGIQVTTGTVTSNFNDIYTPNGGGAIGFLTADRITLTDWRTNTSQDLNSSNADPQFIDAANPTTPNLHINPSVTTVIEGNGTLVSPPTDDFDGQTRASLTPVDIGADAGNFMGIDLAPPTISYTTLGNTTTTTDRILSISVTDVSGVPTAGVGLPVLYFRKGTSGAFSASQCAFVSGSNYDCTITNASVGGVAPGDTIQYYVAAQDTAATPNVTTNPSAGASGFTANPPAAATPPTTPNSYIISVAFSGTKTVCAAGCDYTSLTGAAPGGIFAAINTGVVTGSINIEINGDLTGEPGTTALNKLSVEPAGSPFTLKLYPTGAPRTISGAAASTALIKLNGADRITIDGSLGGVGTDRSLTIENTSVTTPQVIRIGSIGTTPVTADTVKNCIIRNGVNTSSAVVIVDTGGSTAGYFNNITIQNNDIQKAFVGVFANAALLAGNGSGLLYTQNKLDTTGTNAIRNVGLYVQGADGATVSGNTIGNFNATNDENDTGIWFATGTVNSTISGNTVNAIGYTGTTTNIAYGIRDSGGVAASGNNITQNTVSNITSNGNSTAGPTVFGIETSSGGTTIQRNNLQNVIATNTGTFGATGINISAGNNSVVKNNFVSNVTGDMSGGAAFSTTFGIFGIRVAAGTGHQIYNNSVNLFGARTGTATSSLLTAAFALVSTASTGVDVRNNIFANNITGGTTSIANVSAFLPSGGTASMNLTWNNNSYYYGTDVARAGVGQGGATAGTNFYTTLAALTAYTSTLGSATNDNASLASTGAVPFTSASDLHISSGAAEVNTGATIATVTNDYDGETRPQGAGYEIGADEIITVVAPTVQFSSATYSGAEGAGVTITVTRTGDTTGASSVNYATSDGTATGGAACGVGFDYQTASGTLNFAATETSKTFNVQLCTDGAAKANETVNLTLSSPTGSTLGAQSTAVLTITDVPPPMPGVLALSSATYSVGEGGGNLTVTVNRTSGSDGAVAVDYTLTDATATGGASCGAGVDFVNTGGTVNFAGGETSKTFNVAICEDAALESSETFTIGLQNATGGATIGSPSSATATIIDNEVAAPGSLQFSAPTYTVSEGVGTATITATRTGGTDGTVGVSYATVAGGSATGGGACGGSVDYVTTSGTLSWANGDSAAKTFSITVCDDNVYETPSPETVNLALTSPTGGAVLGAQSTAVLNINENDAQPSLQFSVATDAVSESAGIVSLTVTRTGAAGNMVTVDFATGGGTATSGVCAPGVDYVANSGTLTFNPGDGSKIFGVTVCNDSVYEANQTFNITLSNPTGSATLGTPSAETVTINNDDAAPTVAVNDISQAEGNAGTTNFQTTFTVTGASEVAGGFSFQTADSTATAPSDYTAITPLAAVIPANVNRTTATLNGSIVLVNGDTQFEANETFFLNGSSCTDCSFTDNQGVATIQNDDVQPTVQFSSATYSNSDDIAKLGETTAELAPSVATITVTRTGATGDAFSVNYGTVAGGTATGGASCTTGVDYISTSGSLSFAAGDTSKTFNVTVCTDNLFEGSETVNLALTSPTAPVILGTPATAVLTLQDNETVPTLQFSSATYTNSDDLMKYGVTTAEFAPSVATITVTRTGAVDNAVTVNYATSNGSATGGASCTTGVDYINASGTLSFAAGVTSQTFNVTVCTDALFEGNETVNLTLSNPSAPAALGTPNSAVLTIIDNDAQPSLQFSSATYGIGEGGGSATITVTRTGAVDNAVSVNYGTVAGGTATGGASCGGAVDYQNTSGTLSFAAGETSKTFSVPVCDDASAESSETVNLALSAPSGGAVLGTPNTAVLTITDNDSAPTLQFSAANYAALEGAGGGVITLTVTRSGATGNAVSVDYATGGGTATAGACAPGVDYVAASGTLNFATGETSKTFNVTICNDAVYEANQTFDATLSNPTGGAALGAPNPATVTINNDDAAPTVAINDISQAEGNAGTSGFQTTFTVTGASEVGGGFAFATANDTATAGSDYITFSIPTVVVPADVNRTSANYNGANITVNGDTTVEPDETFFLNGSTCSNCSFTDSQGIATILNDDTSVQFAQPLYTVSEGVGTVTLTVTRTGSSTGAIGVNYAFAGITAIGAASCGAGVDFAAVSGTLNWASGDNAPKTFNVQICDDALVESTESFISQLQSPTGGATIGAQSSTQVDITDNDSDSTAPVITYTPISSNPAMTSLTATVTDAVGVTGVSIFWKINGGSFTSAPCSSASGTPQNGTWTCIITGAGNPSAVAYYVTATDAAANTGTNPTGGAAAPNLFTIGAATVPAGTYTNLHLGNGATIGGNVIVNAVLTLGGIVNTGANTLTLGCGATVTGGGETAYVIGKIEKIFCGLETFTYPVGAAFALPPVTGEDTSVAPEGVASNYSPVTVQITGGTVGSSLTVSATDAFMTGAVQVNSISRFWTLTENGNLTANLTFSYRNEDVVGNESQYNVLRRAGGMTSNFPGGSVNGAANTFSAPNVSDFSDWSAGVAVPTAASAEISGRLVTASGEGIRNATVMITGGSLTHPVYVQTGSFGAYRFGELAVGQVYVVTVISKRYTFANPSRVVNLSDSATDENFVANEQ